MIQAVLDANVLVAAVLKESGTCGQILKVLFEEGRFRLVTSLAILEETREVLREEEIRRRHGWSDEEIDAFILRLFRRAVVTAGRVEVRVVEADPEDDKIIACAVEGTASCIVSGDAALQAIREYQGIAIVSPRVFLDMLQGQAVP